MAAAARKLGYEYIAITDHSQSLKITNGLTEPRLREQIDRIDELNSRIEGIRILKSAEVDILVDGSLYGCPQHTGITVYECGYSTGAPWMAGGERCAECLPATRAAETIEEMKRRKDRWLNERSG